MLHNGDSIVIGYGPLSSFPHAPSTLLLKELAEGKGGLGCSDVPGLHKAKSCTATSTTSSSQSSASKK